MPIPGLSSMPDAPKTMTSWTACLSREGRVYFRAVTLPLVPGLLDLPRYQRPNDVIPAMG
jgi:hypothetical protein